MFWSEMRAMLDELNMVFIPIKRQRMKAREIVTVIRKPPDSGLDVYRFAKTYTKKRLWLLCGRVPFEECNMPLWNRWHIRRQKTLSVPTVLEMLGDQLPDISEEQVNEAALRESQFQAAIVGVVSEAFPEFMADGCLGILWCDWLPVSGVRTSEAAIWHHLFANYFGG